MRIRLTVICLFLLGCSISPIKRESSNQEFCSKNYGHQAQIDWVMGSQGAKGGAEAVQVLKGFTCAYSIANSSESCEGGTKLEESGDNYLCRSRDHELKELCSDKEILRYWEDESMYKQNCK